MRKSRQAGNHPILAVPDGSDYAEQPHSRIPASQQPNSAMRHNPAYGITVIGQAIRTAAIASLERNLAIMHMQRKNLSLNCAPLFFAVISK